MQVFVTGGTGQIGSRLVLRLMARGDTPVVLSRRPAVAKAMFGPGCKVVEGDPMQPGPWQDAAAECDAVVNLAGENQFARRWNAAFKTLVVDSRIQATQNVVAALARKPCRADGRPKTLVSGSAIGFYGSHSDEELTEDSPPGSDFLADLCVQWEKAAREVERSGVRCALMRTGIVLDRRGGALAKLLTPFSLGVGGPVAGGRQWMSWIHHEDMTGLLLRALDDGAAAGPINGTAPNPVTNGDFSRALGKALHRWAFMPLPGFVLRLRFGEVACVVTTGQRVLPKRALALGYSFQYPQIDAALAEIVAS
ncbi:MAG TPA: TIGR01777 family oxidoreductase [Gemmataceae bacterium]|nr:TIGR01777 family oxidoreductase [Gemmataceae bacterium]